jgi:glucose-6-phosphate 1-dehydrogenase
MSFAKAFAARYPDVYERLLMDVVRGNQTLFMHSDEVDVIRRRIDSILQIWAQSSEPPRAYTAGTCGCSAAIALLERDDRTWNEETS